MKPLHNILGWPRNHCRIKRIGILEKIADELSNEESVDIPINGRKRKSSNYTNINGDKIFEVDPEDIPPLLPMEMILCTYKDAKCVTEHISKEPIKGTLVVSNFKLHFLSKTQELKKGVSPTMANVRSAILNMPLGFVNKVEPIGDENDPFKIKVDCKDMRHFVLLLGDPIQKNPKRILQNISDLKINNPLLTALANWVSKSIFPPKSKLKANSKPFILDELNMKFNKKHIAYGYEF